jgi:hypothetical protein
MAQPAAQLKPVEWRMVDGKLLCVGTAVGFKVQKFSFLCLPAELRINIYECVLPTQQIINIATHHRAVEYGCLLIEPTEKELEICTELFLVNKQVNDEAVGIFYGTNMFVFNIGLVAESTEEPLNPVIQLAPWRHHFAHKITMRINGVLITIRILSVIT